MLPLADFRRDFCASQFLLPGESVVYRPELLGGRLCLDNGLVAVSGEGVGDSKQPVLCSITALDLTLHGRVSGNYLDP